MFSGVDSIAEDDSLMLEENIENDNGPNNRSISLQSGLLVQFNDPIPPEEFPSLSHFRSPHVYYERRSVHQRRSFSGNHHRRYSPIKVDIRERLSFSGHRYHDKRSECDPSDECYSLGLSQSSIRGDYDNDERNLRLQISETNINNDYSEDYEHYDDEMVIERSSSPEEDSKHRKFKNEKKTQVYHDYDKDRSPQIHLEYCDGQKKLLLEKKRYTVR